MSKKSKKQRIHDLEMENFKLRTEIICLKAGKFGLSAGVETGWVPNFRKKSEFKNYISPITRAMIEANPLNTDFEKYKNSWIEEFKNNPDSKKPFIKYLIDKFNLELPVPDQLKKTNVNQKLPASDQRERSGKIF